jgi:SRSO17 transposase
MMAVVSASEDQVVDAPLAVRERLEAFGVEVLAEAMNRPVQVRNGGLYMRGLIEQGQRKSLEPLVNRLGGVADYQSMQQFVADSPWDSALAVKAVAERVVPVIDVQAWVLDDTGFPKDGKDSPGVKRQYSGTLGKTGNCQIGVSVHAVGGKGTVPLGWALYLPEEWCDDPGRRRKAKIPEEIEFQTKSELAAGLVERAAGWAIARVPILGDCAYGKNTALRERLNDADLQYVLSVSEEVSVFAPDTDFQVPETAPGRGRPRSRPQPGRKPKQLGALVARLDPAQFKTVTFRDGPEGKRMTSRFAFLRVRAAKAHWKNSTPFPPREEWLIVEWPEGKDQPTDYWLSNLPASTKPERLARLARLRWKIELDYKQLKGELGLDHYEGRSWLGWYHHTALVTATHGFLTLERLNPLVRRPA